MDPGAPFHQAVHQLPTTDDTEHAPTRQLPSHHAATHQLAHTGTPPHPAAHQLPPTQSQLAVNKASPGPASEGGPLLGRVGGMAPIDVFLSHAGEQKRTVVDHLNAALLRHSPPPTVFLDEYTLPPGHNAQGNIELAMQQCAVAIFILTPEFVTKPYPMQELHTLLQRARQPGDPVLLLPVLYTLAYSQATNLREQVYAGWEWDEGARPDAKVLEQWAQDVMELMTFSPMRRDKVFGEAELVERVAAATIAHLKAAQRLGRPHPGPDVELPAYLVCMEDKRDEVVRLLEHHSVVLLHGVEGIGKTVLAKAVYKALKDRGDFKGVACSFVGLVCDTPHPIRGQGIVSLHQKERVQRRILKHLCGAGADDADSLDDGRCRLRQKLLGRQVLVVVDNVCDEDLLDLLPDDLMTGVVAPGSVLLTTSRQTTMLQHPASNSLQPVGYTVPRLTPYQAEELFRAYSGCDSTSSELSRDGKLVLMKRILQLCVGLPKAVLAAAAAVALHPDPRDWHDPENDLREIFRHQGVQISTAN